MAITITPNTDAGELCIAGDIEARLPMPFAGPSFVTMSDGTLLRIDVDHQPDYAVVIEGAGNVIVSPTRESLTVDWCIEWVSIMPVGSLAVVQAPVESLPLFRRRAVPLRIVA